KIITKRLLNLQFNKNGTGKEDPIIQNIIKEITEDICVHNYPIYCDEAETLGLKVLSANKTIEKLVWGLFELYSDAMKLTTQINPIEEIGTAESLNGNHYGAFIESVLAEDVFNFNYSIKKQIQTMNGGNGMQIPIPNAQPIINMNISKAKWEKLR
ncbi:MAG: hypothetical protein ABUT20_61700, partial [Bacteroidota bacterium]